MTTAKGWITLSDIQDWEEIERPPASGTEPVVEIAPWMACKDRKEAYYLGLRMGHFGKRLATLAENAPRIHPTGSTQPGDLRSMVWNVLEEAITPISAPEVGRRCGKTSGYSQGKIREILKELVESGQAQQYRSGYWKVAK